MEMLEQREPGRLELLAGAMRQDSLPHARPWAEWSVKQRVVVLQRFRHAVSRRTDAFCLAINASPARTDGDVIVTEILPLLSACEFLERSAGKVLKTRQLGWRGRPAWVGRVRSEVQRVPLGTVLIIGPSNYPLFLPGVQVLQALTAGNMVTWKAGRGGLAVAKLFTATLVDAGLPQNLVCLTEDTDEAGEIAVAAGADKVFFTGSADTGRAVMRRLAETATPSVMELSDSAAVVLLPTAEIERAVAAIVFGIRLNGSATCMAPRRLLVMGTTTQLRDRMVARLAAEFEKVAPAILAKPVGLLLKELVDEARAEGAKMIGQVTEAGAVTGQRPVLVVGVKPAMRIAQADIFAPLLCVIDVVDADAVLAAQRACSLALTASIFGDETDARTLAGRMQVGTVVINDLIAPTADPRVSFGGRRASGFGVTRGVEGLLEMTAVKTVMVQRSESERHYKVTGAEHARLFLGLVRAGHAKSWYERWAGVQTLFRAGRSLNARTKETKAND